MSIKIKNLQIKYGKRMILDSVDIDLPKERIISILGKNGSGKTTLLKSMMNLINFSGEILIDSKNIKNISTKSLSHIVSYVPQDTSLAFDFTVLDLVLMGRFSRSAFLRYSQNDVDFALDCLEQIGIKNLKDSFYNNLSGGQKQMVLIARALAQNSPYILLDEPTNGLDFGNIYKLLALLKKLQQSGKTVIQTTHNPEHTALISDNVLILKDSKVYAFGGAKEVLTTKTIDEIYNLQTEVVDLPNSGKYFCPTNIFN